MFDNDKIEKLRLSSKLKKWKTGALDPISTQNHEIEFEYSKTNSRKFDFKAKKKLSMVIEFI
jgi:hypothetical protein